MSPWLWWIDMDILLIIGRPNSNKLNVSFVRDSWPKIGGNDKGQSGLRTSDFGLRTVKLAVFVSFVSALLLGCTPSIDPQTAFYLGEAQKAYENQVYNVALAFTDSAKTSDSELPETYFLRGRIYTELARFDLADSAYTTALSLNPTLKGAWLNRGNLALRKGIIRPAISMYTKEADAHPSASVFLQMGRAYSELGEADSALFAYERALQFDSTRATIFMRLGQLYGERGDVEPAIAYMQKGIELEPENLNYRYTLGALLNTSGEFEKAVQHLRPFADANPWHYWGHYNLGQAYQRMDQSEEASFYLAKAESLQTVQTELDHWRMMAESNPRHLMLWIRFAFALRKAGNTADADRADRIAYSIAPDYLVHAFEDSTHARGHSKAVFDVTSGNLDQAIENYRALLRDDISNHGMWLNLGVVYATHGRIVQARQSWDAALKYNNQFLRARRYIEDLDKAFYDPEAPGNSGLGKGIG